MAADDILEWRQHYTVFCKNYLIVIFSTLLIRGHAAYPLINDVYVARRRGLFDEWLYKIMRGQSEPNALNTIPTDNYELEVLDDLYLDNPSPVKGEDVGDELAHVKTMGDVVALMPGDARNVSLNEQWLSSTAPTPGLLTSNADEDWWTLCQLPVFIVLLAVVAILIVTFVVLLWLKSQMLESEKEISTKGGEAAQKTVFPCSTHNAADDRWIFHTVINLKCGSEEKTTVAVQPQESSGVVEDLVHRKVEQQLETSTPKIVDVRATPSPSPTPEKRPEVVRIRAKGLLERRGSNVSLTIDLPQANGDAPTHVITPTRECSTEEFLLSAGNALCRSQLKTCLRDTGSLHREFWDIPLNHPEEGQAVGCASKNRYRSILPNERSRVLLDCTEDSYINANYIRGYDGEEKVYIATQGPLCNTVCDFYHMVWAHRCPIVVMMTHLVEKTKPKCEPYFPLGLHESATYGDFEVSVVELLPRQGYVVRHLLVQYKGEARRILHYWFDTWPDHKTPQNTHTILAMAAEVEKVRTNLKNIKSPNNNDSDTQCTGPVVVHCSAGIGRTGCFIAISLAICQLLEEDKVDVLGIVCQMRYDRGGMIQTAEQYEFVHRAIAMFASSLPDATPSAQD